MLLKRIPTKPRAHFEIIELLRVDKEPWVSKSPEVSRQAREDECREEWCRQVYGYYMVTLPEPFLFTGLGIVLAETTFALLQSPTWRNCGENKQPQTLRRGFARCVAHMEVLLRSYCVRQMKTQRVFKLVSFVLQEVSRGLEPQSGISGTESMHY